jgi:predicted nucleic acid-binding Zn ribbon protein
MMTYSYKCDKCSLVKEISIETYDITGSRGIVNLEALNDRIYKNRECECGGNLRKFVDATAEPMFFDYVTVGKINRTYK